MSTNTYSRSRSHLRLIENTGSARSTDHGARRQRNLRLEADRLADLEAEVRETRDQLHAVMRDRVRLLALCQRHGIPTGGAA